MCTLIIVTVLTAGGSITTTVPNLPCPVDTFKAEHWVPDVAAVSSINTVTVREAG